MNEQPNPLYRCKKCGRESAIQEAFTSVKGGSGKAEEFLCFECTAKQQARSLVSNFLILLGLGLLLTYFTRMSWLGRFYLLLCLGLVLSPPLIVLHEAAHLLAARMVGFRVFGIHLGAGKVIHSARFLGLRWFLRQIPISGATIVSGLRMPQYRFRKFLVHLAGPGLHLALMLVSLGILSGQLFAQRTGALHFWAQAGFWINLLLLLGNLYPHKVATAMGVIGTDGWAMIHIFRVSQAELDKQLPQYYVLEAVDAIDVGQKQTARQWIEKGLALYPNDLFLINGAGFVYSHLGEYQQARSAFVSVLESDPSPNEGLKNIALNNIAFADLMLEDSALLPEADAYSEQAYKNLPWETLIGGTRGAVLVALGKPDKGIELLKKAMAGSFELTSKALDACLIARGEIRRGNRFEAKKYLEAARQLDPECNLLERISAEMEPIDLGNFVLDQGEPL